MQVRIKRSQLFIEIKRKNMIKKLLKGAKGYEKQSVLTVILVLLETALEVVLPLLM